MILNARNTSLSLNGMLVSGFALANGYGGVQAPSGWHFLMTACPEATQSPALALTLTLFVVVQQTVPVAISVTI